MSIKQNAIDFCEQYPLAASTVKRSFYVDDCLTGADSLEEAITLQRQLQELFLKGGFLPRKWTASNPSALSHLPDELMATQSLCPLPAVDTYIKTLGLSGTRSWIISD